MFAISLQFNRSKCYCVQMKRRTALGLALAAAAPAADNDARPQFIGVWNLVTFERTASDGTVTRPYGPAPVGRITYDKAGRMSAQLMRPGRRHASLAAANNSTDSLRNASCDDLKEMANGFASYFGTFDVDVASKTVIHHVKGAMLPSWAGTDLKRAREIYHASCAAWFAKTNRSTIQKRRWPGIYAYWCASA